MTSLESQFADMVPPLENLLSNGVPSVAGLDMYIADLDINLEENEKQIDSCLQDMLQMVNTLVGKEYITPKDALLSMLSSHILEKDSCYDPNSDAVTEILSHVVYMLGDVQGCEEDVFQDLLSLSSEQGLVLPLKSTAVDPIASTLSLNTVSDNSEIHISQQWDQISLHLRRYYLEKLTLLPVVCKKPSLDILDRRRLKYLQSLTTLQPVDEVWDRYQSLRQQQLEKCLSRLMPETDTENIDILKISEHCCEIAQIIIQMMNEDFSVLTSGIIKKPSSLFHAFHKTYLDKFSDEMSALIDEVWDEVRGSVQRGMSQSVSMHGSKKKNKSPKSSTKSLHASLNSIADASVKVNQPAGISAKYINVIINIITALQQIEEHMNILQEAAIWDVGGVPTSKPHKKGSLKGVLKPSSSPDLSWRPSSAAMSIDSDSCMSDIMVSSQCSNTSMFDLPAAHKVTVIEKIKLEEQVKWDWRFIVKKIAGELGVSVGNHIQVITTESLDAEVNLWKSSHSLQTVSVRESLWGGRLDYPKVICKGVSDIMQTVDMFSVFAKAGTDNSSLASVKTAYVDVTSTCLKTVHAHLLKLSHDVPRESPMKNLYVLLSSAAYVRNYLLHLDTMFMQEESKKPFSVLYKQFVELVELIQDQLIQCHNNYIATSILHDTDSHNWADTKEFYEGERCSFSVQMWNYYLRGIQYDMSAFCPPKLTQTTLSILLHDSLQLLTLRYTQAKPSFRRVTQFRCDILSILLCVSELLYPCSNSVSRILDAGHSQVPHYSIHNLCTSLLSTMAVVTAPLEQLYKVNKKGYRYRQKRKSNNQADQGSNSNWLSWIHPNWLDKRMKSFNDMQTTTALYLQTKLLLSQPEINFPQTLQAYLMKDYTLSILFLTQAVTASARRSGNSAVEKVGRDECNFDSLQEPLTDVDVPLREFTLSLFRILMQDSNFSDGLAKVVMAVIERQGEWDCLNAKLVPGKDIPIPSWMAAVFYCMRTFTQRTLKPVLDYVLTQSESKQITPIAAVIEELPCGCRSHATQTPRSARKSDAGRVVVNTVLSLVLNQISEDIFVLPASLCVLFKALEQQCVTKGMKTTHNCVGIKFVQRCDAWMRSILLSVHWPKNMCKMHQTINSILALGNYDHFKVASFLLIATSFREYLLNTEKLCEDLGFSLTKTVIEELEMLADCIYHVLVSGKVKSSSTPRLAGRFCKDNRDWINDKIQTLVFYLSSDIFDVTENTLLSSATTEFLDQFYVSFTSDILNSPSGPKDIENLYWMLSNNMAWLHKQLDMKHVLPPQAETSTDLKTETFVIDMVHKALTPFNPLLEFQMIGTAQFDHETIQRLTFDWERLLQSDLGLGDIGFRTLLYNRHDMQDGAYLEEIEKKPVAQLKAIFESDIRELR